MTQGHYERTLEIRAKQAKANAAAWQVPEIRAKYLAALADRPPSLAGVEAMHKALEEYRKDAEWRAKFSLSQQKPHSQYIIKDREAYNRAHQAQAEKLKGRMFTEEHKRRLSEAGRLRVKSQEEKEKQSRTQKRNWADPEFARRMAISQRRKPNSTELELQSILDRCFPGEWKYVGDGQIWIGGRNPDFININGKKQLIELFGQYWHGERAGTSNDEQGKINHYKQYGFDCLVIWDNQLTDKEVLKCLH